MNMQNPNKKFKPSPRAFAQAKYNVARMNLIWVVAFTAINIILTAVQADIYFLFSATVPLIVTATGLGIYMETAALPVLIICVVIAVVLTVPYIVCWKLSQKHYGWMIGALVYFCLDSVLLLLSFDVSLILDLLFHAWVLYYLIIGVKYGKQLQALPVEEPVTDADYVVNTETTENTDPTQTVDTPENNQANDDKNQQ